MPQEIERKFLVKDFSFKPLAEKNMRIIQGYLSSVPERNVRVRIHGNKGCITVKGATNDSGTTRYEWEKEIPIHDAEELLKICEPGIIEKTRYLVKIGNATYEVDEFHGDNEGLIIAEIELPSENATFNRASFLDLEVTGELKYYNSMLTKKPYKKWQ
ncbi:MAG: CYTH domain-containing protein [Dysgonamonadaceae bacterium]|jgi:adenylate cyclase|nr:CYTH domain-containing protein [Dysgonamonadaceae bacterium]